MARHFSPNFNSENESLREKMIKETQKGLNRLLGDAASSPASEESSTCAAAPIQWCPLSERPCSNQPSPSTGGPLGTPALRRRMVIMLLVCAGFAVMILTKLTGF